MARHIAEGRFYFTPRVLYFYFYFLSTIVILILYFIFSPLNVGRLATQILSGDFALPLTLSCIHLLTTMVVIASDPASSGATASTHSPAPGPAPEPVLAPPSALFLAPSSMINTSPTPVPSLAPVPSPASSFAPAPAPAPPPAPAPAPAPAPGLGPGPAPALALPQASVPIPANVVGTISAARTSNTSAPPSLSTLSSLQMDQSGPALSSMLSNVTRSPAPSPAPAPMPTPAPVQTELEEQSLSMPNPDDSENILNIHAALVSLDVPTFDSANSPAASRSDTLPASPTVSPPSSGELRVEHTDPRTRTFLQLLDADALVDEAKLRMASASGVPTSLRSQVWGMLLGVAAFQSSQDMSIRPSRIDGYANLVRHIVPDPDISRRIRRLLSRSRSLNQSNTASSAHRRSVPDDDLSNPRNSDTFNIATNPTNSVSGRTSLGHDTNLRTTEPASTVAPVSLGGNGIGNGVGINSTTSNTSRAHRRRDNANMLRSSRTTVVDSHLVARYSRVISCYLQNSPTVEFDEQLVYLVNPFLEVMASEAEAFYAFSAMMATHAPLFTPHGLQDAVSQFKSMFRALHAELYDMFVMEDFDVNKWARNWLRGLLVEQLPKHVLLRLWDSYFAHPPEDGLLLHPYVCLVFIQHVKSELLDCDDAERMSAILSSLHPVDTDHVIAHAITIRAQLCDRGVM